MKFKFVHRINLPFRSIRFKTLQLYHIFDVEKQLDNVKLSTVDMNH